MAERDKRIADIARLEFNASSANGLHFHVKAWKKTARGEIRIRYCAFHKESQCPFRIREINLEKPEDGCPYALEVGSWEHSSHYQSKKSRGLPVEVKSKMGSPALKERPMAVLAKLSKDGVEIDEKTKEQVNSFLFRQKAQAARESMPKGGGRTWGGVEAMLQKCKPGYIFMSSIV